MPDLVASNDFLKLIASYAVGKLNGNCWLKLYTNNLPPTPANVLANFQEATFGGYFAQAVAGSFPGPNRAQDGEYASQSPEFSFSCGSAPTNVIYGWYITDGSIVLLSSPFLLPIVVNIGTKFTVSIEATTWSTFTLGL